jgi:hypothetical protein
LQPVVLIDCRAKACAAKKQVSVDLIFCYFLIKQKVKERPRQLSGQNILLSQEYKKVLEIKSK